MCQLKARAVYGLKLYIVHCFYIIHVTKSHMILGENAEMLAYILD